MRRRAGCGASLSCPSTRTPCILRASWPLRFPRTPPLPSRAAPSPRPRATLGDPEAGPPHLSAGLAKPPDLLLGSRLREPPPGHPPARWRRRRRLRSERAPPCTGQGGRRARRLTRGAGALGRREVPVSYRAARAGHPGSGRGAGGRSPGARPRGRAPPPRSARTPGTRAQRGGHRRRRRRAAEAGTPRPAPRRGVRAQPARSAAGRAVPLLPGWGELSVRWLLLVACPLASHRHPRGQMYLKPRVL